MDLPSTPDKALRELFKYAFTNNCSLDDESTTQEELKTLEELETSELIENLKELITSLLKFKRESQTCEKSELIRRSEQFEQLLQKHEAEIRNHIRVQHQLKLHIEMNSQKIKDLEKNMESDKEYIKELEGKVAGNRLGEVEKLKKEFEEKMSSWLEIIERKERNLRKIEVENTKLRSLLEMKAKECEVMKKEQGKGRKKQGKDTYNSTSCEMLQKKLDSIKFGSAIREKSALYHQEHGRTDRKSLEDTEISKFSTSPYLRKDTFLDNLKKEMGKPLKKGSLQGHIRSISDQKLMASRRLPSS